METLDRMTIKSPFMKWIIRTVIEKAIKKNLPGTSIDFESLDIMYDTDDEATIHITDLNLTITKADLTKLVKGI